MEIQTLRPGTGAKPQPGNKVTVHYSGYLQTGEEFDSSVKRGQPFTFNLAKGDVIKGWDMAIQKMSVG